MNAKGIILQHMQQHTGRFHCFIVSPRSQQFENPRQRPSQALYGKIIMVVIETTAPFYRTGRIPVMMAVKILQRNIRQIVERYSVQLKTNTHCIRFTILYQVRQKTGMMDQFSRILPGKKGGGGRQGKFCELAMCGGIRHYSTFRF
ncbi:hypothetical protein C5Q97_00275 [Victivallales bacterium CCUG 44730]|nr:hypothetical protein C5Q97_00275 [Victivallales bacterium CCUG 44730]HBP05664.1 hypothetical protein [Lentisphaeria bacterium]